MSPISTRKSTRICKRRKLNDDGLLVRLDENKRKHNERTHSSNSSISFDGLLSIENSSECSSSNADEKLFLNCSSARDICIFVLINHGLLLNRREDVETRTMSSQNKIRLLKCKSCATVGQSTKMLICDSCEGPFHLKCSGMLLRKALPEEWYCYPCSRNKRRRISGKTSLESKNLMNRSKQLREEKMLKHTSRIRIGEAFQANVQEWFGPIHDDDDYHEKLEGIRPGELGYLNVQESNITYSYCNWIQCRDEFKGTVCGKWRRAPLFEIQTDNWDCSCSLLWDPSYADCAVPQELETSEVMKHLEYVNSLRHRLAKKEIGQKAIHCIQ